MSAWRFLLSLVFSCSVFAGEGHDHGPGDEHPVVDSHDGEVSLSPQQMILAGIKTAALTAKVFDYQVYAPGEVKANGYTSYQVSPRIDSVVLRRHVALGEHVHKGQALVTLFSEAMIDAQTDYVIAELEWQRVQQLSRKVVEAKHYEAAQTGIKAAYAKLTAFGLDKKAIEGLSDNKGKLGEYTLTAAIDGAVLADNFHQGQRVGAGEALIELVDESQLWVEASLPATTTLSLPVGSEALVKVGDVEVQAKVTQEAHTIDRQTRTRTVRLLMNNSDDRFHAGMFADVWFLFKTEKPVLALPQSALMRSADGDWQVFVEDEAGNFKALEVTLGRSLNKWREVIGVEPGSNVVIEGAFFVASELAKDGFDPHNH